MATPFAELVAALRAEHDDLARRVAGFTLDDLRRRSGADEWSVAQVLSHLGSGAVIGLATLDAAAAGAELPGGDFNKDVWARWDAMDAEAQAAEYLAADGALVARYEALTAEEAESVRVDYPWLPAPLPLADVARMRLTEVALHAWDVRVAFDGAAAVSQASVSLLLKAVPTLLGRVAKPDALAARPATIAVTTTDPDAAFTLAIGGSAAIYYDHPAGGENALALPAESWLRLVTGRLRADRTPASAVSTGPIGLDELRAVFPGY